MRKAVLYARAFCLVMKRRYEKRKAQRRAEKDNPIVKWGNEEKKKGAIFYYCTLGGIAIAAVCCSGFTMFKIANRVNDLHAMNTTDAMEEASTVFSQEPIEVKEVPAEESVVAISATEKIEEEDVPLAATMVEADDIEGLGWKQVTDVSAVASSVLQSETKKSYSPLNLLDNDLTTNWQEGEEGYGEGTVLTFSFDGPVTLSGMEIVNGNGVSEKKYLANSRPKDIVIRMGTKKVQYTLADQFGKQLISLSPELEIDELDITIDSVYEGAKYTDTCISDINFFEKK